MGALQLRSRGIPIAHGQEMGRHRRSGTDGKFGAVVAGIRWPLEMDSHGLRKSDSPLSLGLELSVHRLSGAEGRPD